MLLAMCSYPIIFNLVLRKETLQGGAPICNPNNP